MQELWNEIGQSSWLTRVGVVSGLATLIGVGIAWVESSARRRRDRHEKEREAPQVKFVIDQMRFGNGWRHAVAEVRNRLDEDLEIVRIRITRPRHIRVAPQKEGDPVPDLQKASDAWLQPPRNRVGPDGVWGTDVYWWLKGDEDAVLGKSMWFEIELRQVEAARSWKVHRDVRITEIIGQRRP
jgi:hypothetical protein